MRHLARTDFARDLKRGYDRAMLIMGIVGIFLFLLLMARGAEVLGMLMAGLLR